MRRPVSVKYVFLFFLSFHEKASECQVCFSFFPFLYECFCFSLSPCEFLPLSQAAPVAILPSALFCERYCSVQGGCSRFSRCCYLIIDLSSHRFGESRAP